MDILSKHIYIYKTSEKPVNNQSYVGSLRYSDTIQVKMNHKRLKWFVKITPSTQHKVIKD